MAISVESANKLPCRHKTLSPRQKKSPGWWRSCRRARDCRPGTAQGRFLCPGSALPSARSKYCPDEILRHVGRQAVPPSLPVLAHLKTNTSRKYLQTMDISRYLPIAVNRSLATYSGSSGLNSRCLVHPDGSVFFTDLFGWNSARVSYNC